MSQEGTPKAPQTICDDCKDLVGANTYIRSHEHLVITVESDDEELFRCDACGSEWGRRTSGGWWFQIGRT